MFSSLLNGFPSGLVAAMTRESDSALHDAAGVLALFLMLVAMLSLPGLI